MARLVDESKMERIKLTALELITAQGFSATTIGEIAEQADVSAGYLYRHCNSKSELIEQIYEEKMGAFHSQMRKSLSDASHLSDFISDIIDYLHLMIEKDTATFNFLFVMLHDHTFSFPETRLISIREISSDIYRLGKSSNEINEDIDMECCFYTLFSIPLKFFDSRRRKILVDKPITNEDIARLKRICSRALK